MLQQPYEKILHALRGLLVRMPLQLPYHDKRSSMVNLSGHSWILPSTGQENNIAHQTQISGLTFRFAFHRSDKWFNFPLHFSSLLTISLSFCSLTKGITPKILLVLSCPNKQRSFEPFYVFGSCFRTLAVILVPDFCYFPVR